MTSQPTLAISRWALVLMLGLCLVACGESRSTGQIYQAKFASLDSCLTWVNTHSKQSIRRITTDKPDNVAGFLWNDAFFSCSLKRTGTQGTFFEGSYQIMKEENP